MSYAIEQALRNKADKWEVQNLQNEISQCKRDVEHYRSEIRALSGAIQNHYTVILQLLDLLSQSQNSTYSKDELETQFLELKRFL